MFVGLVSYYSSCQRNEEKQKKETKYIHLNHTKTVDEKKERKESLYVKEMEIDTIKEKIGLVFFGL